MTTANNVNFYLKDVAEEADIDQLACVITNKAWLNGYKVYFLVSSSELSQRYDDLLWSFRQESFIPHAQYSDDSTAPVVIGTDPMICPSHCSAIISRWSKPLPAEFHHLRIIDIIGPSEEEREQARDRYRFYKRAGIEPVMHKL